MKRKRTSLSEARRTAVALAFAAAPALLWAQVALYDYSESVEPYTEITDADGGYSLGTPTWWPPVYNMRAFVDPNNLDGTVTNGYLSPAQGPGFPIGFDLTFNGDVFDRVGISNSGWISFGKSSDGNQAVWSYGIDHPHGQPFVQYVGGPATAYKRDRVAGYGTGQLWMQDMSPQVPPGPVSSLRIATIGTAPDRVCVIQWKDFLNAYPPSSSRINFQIRLHEADNSVEVRYGQMIFNSLSETGVQVGLGGRVPQDFNSRKTVYEQPAFLYDWNITVAGVVNTDVCLAVSEQPGHPNGTGVPPVVGRTFKWTPPSCPPPAWPLTFSELTFQSALATWEPTAAGEYAYFVSTENDINGPEVASGTTTEPMAVIEGLAPMTTYFVFVRSICDGEPGTWSLGTAVMTHGGGYVICDGTTVQEEYCSHQFDTVYWSYVSEDGSPLKIEFLDGVVGSAGSESFKLWDGGSPTGAPGFTGSGDLTGHSFLASSGQIFIQLVTDAGSCETQPWYLPFHWRVGCKNCTDPLVQYTVGEVDCEAQEYYVDVNIFSLGSSSTLLLENTLGVPAATVGTTGVHAVGPFLAGETVMITAQNPDNEMCYSESAPLVNEPCVILDCGPTWYTRCAAPEEVHDWLFQGDGASVAVRFLPSSTGFGSHVIVYDGPDDLSPQLVDLSGGTNNQIVQSTNGTHQLLVRMVGTPYEEYACSEGNSMPLKFVVECDDACEQPAATFAYADCTVPTSFSVVVNVTDLGSSGSVVITNDGGAAEVTASTVGTYTVGPFPSASTVVVDVEGASDVCSWTSMPMSKDCSAMGIAETSLGAIDLFPNPSNGQFSVQLPAEMGGKAELQVLDLTGRMVAHRSLLGSGRSTVDLTELPNGLYTLVLRNNGTVANARTIIQH